MVDVFGKWADVRKAAAARPRQSLERFGDGQDLGAELRRLGAQPAPDPTPHGMRIQDLDEMRRNMAAFEPNIAGPGAQAVAKAKLIAEVLPRGASSYPKTAQTTLNTDGGSATTMYHNMRPYQPELEDPSRQMMPQARTQWNKYARLFYKCDAVIPTVVDMLAELSFGDFTLSGDGVEGDVKKDMEASLDACRVQQRLPDMAREYFMLGEAGVHNYFDEEKGYWSYIAIHNPDQLEVIQTPFLPMEPVVEFRPDPTLREILLSQHPMLRELRESLPPEMVAAVIGGRNITLAPNNFTFLARKLHPYEMRGTSILSRLWRILMFEDCFPAGVLVAQPGGASTPIEALRAGDPVLNRFGRPAVVEAAVMKPGDGVLRRITLADGRVVLCTRSHRWPVRGLDGAEVKLEARAIRPGQALMSPVTDRFVYHIVAAVDDVASSVPVYGISVSGDRSYIADGLSTYNSLFNAAIATARRRACFVAGTPVLTVEGLKAIEDVKEGDRVIAGNGKVESVRHAWAELPTGEGLLEIDAVGTQPLFCTPEHKFLVFTMPRECACGCGEIPPARYTRPDGTPGGVRRSAFVAGHHLRLMRNEKTGQMRSDAKTDWKVWSTEPKIRLPASYAPLQKIPAKQIRAGDYLLIPRKFDVVETSVSSEQARVLGYFVAEGHHIDLRGRDAVGLTFSLAEHDTWAADVKSCAATFGVDVNINRYVPAPETKTAESGREGNTHVYIRRGKDEKFCQWLMEHGRVGANHHVLSEEVMRWPLELKRELVRGYFRGDGHFGLVDGCPQVTAASTSKTLIYQMRIILAQLGFFGSIYSNPKAQENWADCWAISSTGRDARALAEMIWGMKLDAPVRNGSKSGGAARTWCDDDYVYTLVRKIVAHDDQVTVYNLSVEGDESYIAEGVQTANSPLKIAKVGNDTFMPPPEYGDKVLRMITQSEMDVHSWLVMLNCVQFELVGVQEQVMSINAHYDLIERVKLSALGVSRALINGEANYSASAAGLTIFMQRLQAIRTMFTREWLIPKFFGVLAEAREWVKPTEAEVAHGVRVKRSHQEKLDRGMYIKPNIEWSKSLDSKVDADRANILAQLEQGGIVKFSSRTKYAAVGLDRDTEWRQIKQEAAEARKVAGDDPMVLDRLGYGAPAPEDGGMGGGGGGGAPATLPPLPPGSLGEFGPPADSAQPPPEQAAGVGVSATEDAEASDLAAAGWEADAISAGKRLLKTFDPADAQDTAPWDQVLDSPAVRAAVATGDARHAWNAIEAWLIGRAYPADVILSLEKALTSRTASTLSKIELEALAAIEAIEAEIGQDGDSSI